MFALILALLQLGTIAWPVANALPARTAVQACPADTPIAHRRLNQLLTGANHAAFRTRAGIPSIDTSDVHVLSDSLDATMCSELNSSLSSQSGSSVTYYAAGGLFFVVQGMARSTTQLDGRTLHSEWAQALVLDSSLRVLGVEGI